jgi:hypothetical protein
MCIAYLSKPVKDEYMPSMQAFQKRKNICDYPLLVISLAGITGIR